MTTAENKPMTLLTVSKEPGVADLPLKVRGAFAKAIIAEREGRHEDADRELQRAVQLESDG